MARSARSVWNAAAHPRGPDGRFIKVGGVVHRHLAEHPGTRPGSAFAKFSAASTAGRTAASVLRNTGPSPAAAPVLPTSSPTRMTKAQYTRLLKDEHVRLAILDGKSEKEARALARPAAAIDDLKARNAALRTALRAKGVDYRTDEQKRTDDGEKTPLLDEVERLASAGGHDGAAKRTAAAKMTVPELRKFVADVKEFQRRKAQKEQAAREGAAAQKAFQRRQATQPATARQVDYILNLLSRRRRSGEGGGFFNGPTDRAGIAKLSQADASAYINSLTGDY